MELFILSKMGADYHPAKVKVGNRECFNKNKIKYNSAARPSHHHEYYIKTVLKTKFQ